MDAPVVQGDVAAVLGRVVGVAVGQGVQTRVQTQDQALVVHVVKVHIVRVAQAGLDAGGGQGEVAPVLAGAQRREVVGDGGLHHLIEGPVAGGHVPEDHPFGGVKGLFVRRAAQHAVHDGHGLGPGDHVVGPEGVAAVGFQIAVDPALFHGGGHGVIVPDALGHVREAAAAGLHGEHAAEDGHELRPGDAQVRQEGAVGVAGDDLVGSQEAHRFVGPVAGHIAEAGAEGASGGVFHKGVDDLGRLGAAEVAVGAENAAAVAADVSAVLVGDKAGAVPGGEGGVGGDRQALQHHEAAGGVEPVGDGLVAAVFLRGLGEAAAVCHGLGAQDGRSVRVQVGDGVANNGIETGFFRDGHRGGVHHVAVFIRPLQDGKSAAAGPRRVLGNEHGLLPGGNKLAANNTFTVVIGDLDAAYGVHAQVLAGEDVGAQVNGRAVFQGPAGRIRVGAVRRGQLNDLLSGVAPKAIEPGAVHAVLVHIAEIPGAVEVSIGVDDLLAGINGRSLHAVLSQGVRLRIGGVPDVRIVVRHLVVVRRDIFFRLSHRHFRRGLAGKHGFRVNQGVVFAFVIINGITLERRQDQVFGDGQAADLLGGIDVAVGVLPVVAAGHGRVAGVGGDGFAVLNGEQGQKLALGVQEADGVEARVDRAVIDGVAADGSLAGVHRRAAQAGVGVPGDAEVKIIVVAGTVADQIRHVIRHVGILRLVAAVLQNHAAPVDGGEGAAAQGEIVGDVGRALGLGSVHGVIVRVFGDGLEHGHDKAAVRGQIRQGHVLGGPEAENELLGIPRRHIGTHRRLGRAAGADALAADEGARVVVIAHGDLGGVAVQRHGQGHRLIDRTRHRRGFAVRRGSFLRLLLRFRRGALRGGRFRRGRGLRRRAAFRRGALVLRRQRRQRAQGGDHHQRQKKGCDLFQHCFHRGSPFKRRKNQIQQKLQYHYNYSDRPLGCQPLYILNPRALSPKAGLIPVPPPQPAPGHRPSSRRAHR